MLQLQWITSKLPSLSVWLHSSKYHIIRHQYMKVLARTVSLQLTNHYFKLILTVIQTHRTMTLLATILTVQTTQAQVSLYYVSHCTWILLFSALGAR